MTLEHLLSWYKNSLPTVCSCSNFEDTIMFSTALNNAYNLSGKADPQTGLYSFTHSFGKVQGDAGIGPQCDLTMSFSSLSTISGNSTGLGSGWSFRLARYNKGGKMLTLNSGESYNVLFSGHYTPWELSHKVKDILVKEEDGKIYICHKNGDTEILQICPPIGNAYLCKFISPSGRYLEFIYMHRSGYNRLAEIRDSKSVLCKIDYYDNSHKVKVTMYPNSSEEAVSNLYYDGKELISEIQMENGQSIQFDYVTLNKLNLISEVTYSTGAKEQIEYHERLCLPHGAPINYLPAVSKHTKVIGVTQPPIVTTYAFEKQTNGDYGPNFWGHLAHIDWHPDYDNLCDYPCEYTYSSVATCGDKVITHKYNKFHQNIEKIEENTFSQDKKVITMEYYSIGEGRLADQPATYELMKKETTAYQVSSKASPSEVKSYVYDEWGNILTKVEVTGITLTNEYYPAEGEAGSCPSHPHGMVYYLKQKVVEANDKSSSKVSSFTYQSLDGIDGRKLVLPKAKSYCGSTRSYTYYDSSNPTMQCLIKYEVVAIGGKSTSTSRSYIMDDNTLTTTETITGHDGLVSTMTKKSSAWSGLALEETNEAGVVTKYTYDLSKRLSSQAIAAGSEYESKVTYTYVDNPQLPSGNTEIGTLVVKTSSLGSSHVHYNGDQHETATYDEDEFGILRKVEEKTYDEQGRVLSQFSFDYAVSPNDHSILSTYTNGVMYSYGSWGERKEIHHNTGIIELKSYDPINRQTTHQLVRRDDSNNPTKVTSSLSQLVTTYNEFHKKTKEEVFDSSSQLYSTTLYDYDGFGRRVRVTNPSQAITKVKAYDSFDRQVEIEQLDGTSFSVSYINFASEKLISSIKIPSLDFTVGEQEYDGLSRVTSRKVNGVQTRFGYQGGLNKPSRQVNGRNQTTLFDQIPEIGNHYTRVASFSGDVPLGGWDSSLKVSDRKFKYAKSSDTSFPVGHIISASSEAANYNYRYTKSGLTNSSTQSVGDLSKTSTFSYTLSGKPLTTTFNGRHMSFEYDQYGRQISTTDGNIKVEIVYNCFEKVIKKSVKQFNSTTATYDLVQTTDINYDEHGREVSRNITIAKTGKTMSIELFYDVESKIVKRVTTLNNNKSLTELLSYDKKSRLLSYDTSIRTTDELLPQNEYGKKFESQKFEYDQLDNIRSIITRFPNGESNKATFVYDTVNKQRLKRISHTLTSGKNAYPSVIKLGYDADGNVTSINDTAMTYTVSGRLRSRNDVVYSYDPFDRLVKSDQTIRCYLGSSTIQEVNGSDVTDFIKHGNIPIAEIRNEGVCKIYGTDNKLSIVSITDDTSTINTTYSPFGASGDNGVRIGYNGELKDVQGEDIYHLGNGTRCYCPAIPGFLAPDSFSPFLGGGLSPYMYCNNDPLNAFDPSGHLSLKSILLGVFGALVAIVSIIAAPFTGGSTIAIAAGIIGGVLGLISTGLQLGADIAAENGNTDLARSLGIASLATGVLGAVVSLGGSIGGEIGTVMKARSVIKATSEVSSQSIDDVATVGFKVKFKFTRFTPESPNDSFLLKGKNLCMELKKTELVGKVGKLRLYKVRTPFEPSAFIRENQLRSAFNIFTKNFQKGALASGAMNTASLVVRSVSGLPSNEDSSAGSGDGGANNAISSNQGLPANSSQNEGNSNNNEDDGNII